MKHCLRLEEIDPDQVRRFGGKACALTGLAAEGYNLPLSMGISTDAYRSYLNENNLQELIFMELGRKDLADMRWEEIWDAALRIRHLFLTTPIPRKLAQDLLDHLGNVFPNKALVVRSSAPAEDSTASSFAGLHESSVNVRGPESFLLAVRKVWASLWSDRALLYRKELKLDLKSSAMAILVQELVIGEKSGVAFCRSPSNPEALAVEAVWGLNQGLVDGSVEPDFWEISRSDQTILRFTPARREIQLLPGDEGLHAQALNAHQGKTAPLSAIEVSRVASLAMQLEKTFGQPQDVEWTWRGDELVLLQSRPITGGPSSDETTDQRSWYLSLHRSLENLKTLRQRIETKIIPGMEKDAQEMVAMDLSTLEDHQLCKEVQRRRRISAYWEQQYEQCCIPMAHGIRLFGEFYNDALKPADPFEFVRLLQGGPLKALERNRQFKILATQISALQSGEQLAENSVEQWPNEIRDRLHQLAEIIGVSPPELLRLCLQLGNKEPTQPAGRDHVALEKAYLEHFAPTERPKAAEILALGRDSYRLRDDDNISQDKVSRECDRAEAVARHRITESLGGDLQGLFSEDPQRGFHHSTARHAPLSAEALTTPLGPIRPRQLQGQPASPGLVTATARVIGSDGDLTDFKAGEILICDAIDPAMTFIVPLAAGIVERRGGMLIHGAIIAREYGIPCVTGIPDAASLIRSGDRLTVDGYLGLVIISRI